MKRHIWTKPLAVMQLACGAAMMSSVPLVTAHAAEDAPPTRTVKYADLDLTKPAGVRALYGRITAAARHVCQLDTVADLQMHSKEQACINQAIDGAVRNVNSPALAQLRFGNLHLASR